MNERKVWLRGMRKYFILCEEKVKDIWTEGMAQRVRALTVPK